MDKKVKYLHYTGFIKIYYPTTCAVWVEADKRYVMKISKI